MPIACQHKVVHGPQFCVSDCPVTVPCGIFDYQRIERPEQLPVTDERIIDVAVLDMNHGWPNLGHDSLVHLVQDAACDTFEILKSSGLKLRALSFDVRGSGILPQDPSPYVNIYLGTGGPGNIDPNLNDGHSEGSQGIQENADWEGRTFDLFDAIREHKNAVLLSVCHTFGVMCRWAGIASPRLRGPEKGGKSTGILENILTPEAKQHPWFGRFAQALPDSGKFRIVDNRLFDLIPNGPLPDGLTAIGYETLGINGAQGEALTMVEWRRDEAGIMPRIFGVNHHPEIMDRARQLMILERKHNRHEVSDHWYQERIDILTQSYPEENSELLLALTSDYTLAAPFRFHLYREIRLRAEALGHSIPLHEDQILESRSSLYSQSFLS